MGPDSEGPGWPGQDERPGGAVADTQLGDIVAQSGRRLDSRWYDLVPALCRHTTSCYVSKVLALRLRRRLYWRVFGALSVDSRTGVSFTSRVYCSKSHFSLNACRRPSPRRYQVSIQRVRQQMVVVDWIGCWRV